MIAVEARSVRHLPDTVRHIEGCLVVEEESTIAAIQPPAGCAIRLFNLQLQYKWCYVCISPGNGAQPLKCCRKLQSRCRPGREAFSLCSPAANCKQSISMRPLDSCASECPCG